MTLFQIKTLKFFDSMKQSKNEENLENFNSSVNFNDGRYEVSFPFKEFHQELGDNYLTSKSRLRILFKKFKENKELLFEYDKIINEKVTDNEVGATHYLGVIKEDKEITKTCCKSSTSCKIVLVKSVLVVKVELKGHL